MSDIISAGQQVPPRYNLGGHIVALVLLMIFIVVLLVIMTGKDPVQPYGIAHKAMIVASGIIFAAIAVVLGIAAIAGFPDHLRDATGHGGSRSPGVVGVLTDALMFVLAGLLLAPVPIRLYRGRRARLDRSR